MKKFIYSILSIIVMFSCDDREITENENFGFEVSYLLLDQNVLRSNNEFKLEIIPAATITDVEFKLSYEVLKGDMYFASSGAAIDENSTVIFTSLVQNYDLIPLQPGDTEVEITIEDNKGGKQTEIISFFVEDISFFVDGKVERSEIRIGEKTNLSYTLEQIDINTEIKYTAKIKLEEGLGTLLDLEGNEIPFDEDFEIVPGKYEYEFQSANISNVVINMAVEDEFGNPFEEKIIITVLENNYNFNVSPEENEIFVLEEKDIELILEQQYDADISYTYSFSSESSDLILLNSDSEILVETEEYNLIPGTTKLTFKSTTGNVNDENYSAIIKVTDQYNRKVEREIKFTISNISFTVEGSADRTEIQVGEKFNLSYIFEQISNNSTLNYTAKFRFVEGSGVIFDNEGNEIEPDISFSVEPGDLRYVLQSNAVSPIIIDYIVDDEFDNSVPSRLELDVLENDFIFNVSPQNSEMFVLEEKDIELFLEQQYDADISYTYSFSSEFNNLTILNSSSEVLVENQEYPIVPGTTRLIFKSTASNSEGNYIAVLKIKDQFGKVVNKSVEILVKRNTFTFSAVTTKPVVNTNESDFLDVDFSYTGNEPLTFKISIITTDDGVNMYPPGTSVFGCCTNSYDISEEYMNDVISGVTDFNIRMNYISQGSKTYTIKLMASNGHEEESTISVNAYQIPVVSQIVETRIFRTTSGLTETYKYGARFDVEIDDNAGIKSYRFDYFSQNIVNINIADVEIVDGYIIFATTTWNVFNNPPVDPLNLDDTNMSITVTDTNDEVGLRKDTIFRID